MSRRNAALYRPDPGADALTVARYYGEKTQRIIAKYGPGPRIHFHSGIRARPRANDVRFAMIMAQEELLLEMLPYVHGKSILDVGCGLGGGAIFWAHRTGAAVRAITIVPEHVELVSDLATRAGVRVDVRLCDAHDLATLGAHDTAIAIESSCYFDRARWFEALAAVLPIGADVHVVDCFLGEPHVAPRFDDYWKTRIGTLVSYEEAAASAGFARADVHDLGADTYDFWTLSMRWSDEALAQTSDHDERARLVTSRTEHAWLQASIASGAIRYLYVIYRRVR